jgi:DNA-binding NtrC family response regulator
MQEALVSLQRVAPSDLSVIIQGEPGTGKEWAARLVHQMSNRAQGPIFTVDCGAVGAANIERELFGYDAISWEIIDIKRSAFEEATGGTLFLHDIEAVPHQVQLKVARAVEYKQFRRIGGDKNHELNVRVVATKSTVGGGGHPENSLSDDFGSRLGAITVTIPPLRKRKTDIPILIERFLNEMRDRYQNPVQGISKEALAICCSSAWPGNVRQLKTAMEYAAIMCRGGMIAPEHLPPYLHNGTPVAKAGS